MVRCSPTTAPNASANAPAAAPVAAPAAEAAAEEAANAAGAHFGRRGLAEWMRRQETRRKVSRQLVNVVNPRLALYTRAGFLALTIMAFNYVFVIILAFVLQRDCTEKTVVDRSLPVTFGDFKTYEEFINLTLSREGVVQEGTTTTTTVSGCVKRNSAVIVAPYMSETCTDTCLRGRWAADGFCDDGGPGSEYDLESNTVSAVCSIGTDCTDCGIRLRPATYEGTGVTTDVPCWNQYLPCRAQDTATSLCNAETCLCTDACTRASNGLCDDGGPGSEWGICSYGADCSDCGPRSLRPPPPPYAPMTRLCTEACAYASDSECDDGGPGAEYTFCVYGTDCTDCGFRVPGSCIDECAYASDGACDDGGPGAEYTGACVYGTDCTDCGFRVMPPPLPPQSPPQSPPQPPQSPPLCNDLCVGFPTYASDGECDDGGPGSEWAACQNGTDCTDCSPRLPNGGLPRTGSTGSTHGAQLQIETPTCGWYKSEEAQTAVGASYRSEMGAKADRFPWCSLEEEEFAIERYRSMSNLTSMDGTRVSLAIRCGFNKMNGYPVTPAGVSQNLSPTSLGDSASGTLTSFTTHWNLSVTTTTKVCPKFSASFSSAFAFTAQIEIVITLVLIYLFKKSALIGDKKGVFDIGVSGILSHDKASEIEKASQAKREGGAPQTTDRLDGEAARLTPEVQMRIDNAQDNAAANAELIKLVHASCATIEDLRTVINALTTEVDALRKVTPTQSDVQIWQSDVHAVGQEEAKSATRAERLAHNDGHRSSLGHPTALFGHLAHNEEHRSSLRVRRSSQSLGLGRPVEGPAEGSAEGPADGAKPVLQTGPDLSLTLYTPVSAAGGANNEATAASAAAMIAASIVDKAPVRRNFRMKQTVRTVVRRLEEDEEAFGV